MSRVPRSESQLFSCHVPTALSGRHSESWQCSEHTCTGLLQRVRGEFISLRVLCSGDGPGDPWAGCSILSTSAHEHGPEQGPEALGLWGKLWVLDKKNGTIRRLRFIMPFSCWNWQMWGRWCQREDNSPCVNRAELFHVALNGWGHSHSLRFLCGPRGLLGP